ncbi:MAG: RNA polymerase sigma-70 factor [Bacteroidales bacterium]|nr:RNA polymerase sigma-70 factor [Bacteroidales bacterium]
MTNRDLRQLKKIRKGDVKAFEQLFHLYYPGLCNYAGSLLRKPEIAEEVVQDVFYNIWKNRKVLNLHTGWHSYLYRSVYNNAMMALRKTRRELPLDEQWAESQLDAEDQSSEELEAGELHTVMLVTLQQLPERTREIFSLSRFEGLKYKEIADKLSISVKTVEANMGKALKALRITLDEFRKTA